MILSACRTPIGSFGGALKDVSAADLGAVVIREAIARARMAPGDVGDVILGCVLQGGAGMNVARQAAIKAGIPVEIPAETVNRVCGSGLQAVVHGVEALRSGYVTAVVAGGERVDERVEVWGAGKTLRECGARCRHGPSTYSDRPS